MTWSVESIHLIRCPLCSTSMEKHSGVERKASNFGMLLVNRRVSIVTSSDTYVLHHLTSSLKSHVSLQSTRAARSSSELQEYLYRIGYWFNIEPVGHPCIRRTNVATRHFGAIPSGHRHQIKYPYTALPQRACPLAVRCPVRSCPFCIEWRAKPMYVFTFSPWKREPRN
ncbi:hypothetical protein M407DRAFT_119068 [Tulasnella calospora MUT 4182]|uniref:Uncharacterized protein n=1 Tax=Tulasnella calospora MUT 4182 TaxID=1051891 RepID=A0A0C3Q1Z5_9AGAM|nr:hypothetical protein M407DRAFT_119068 [Tulasnella calospora MUT 4182]